MSDLKKTANSLLKCREIKAEILRFGMKQLEIEQLIKLLALELEDRDKMITITSALENDGSANILIPED
tara:strand:+ start:114 stop:320 length:207 start_codon:yes stop_codon:yes gene_type:complete